MKLPYKPRYWTATCEERIVVVYKLRPFLRTIGVLHEETVANAISRNGSSGTTVIVGHRHYEFKVAGELADAMVQDAKFLQYKSGKSTVRQELDLFERLRGRKCLA